MKTLLVTGANGFAGYHVCRLFKRLGYRVFGTARQRGKKTVVPCDELLELNVTNRPAVFRIVDKIRPQFVVHLAAQSVPRFSWQMEQLTFEVNVCGTLHLLDAVRRYCPEAKFLHASTIQVYGRSFQTGKLLKENDLLWPEDPYSASKIVSEFACQDYSQRFGLHISIARGFNHVGVRQPVHYVFSDWCRQIALAEIGKFELVLHVGNLENRRDFIHAEDVAAAYEKIIRRGRSGHVYNVGSGQETSLNECLTYLLSRSRVPMQVTTDPGKFRRQISTVMKADCSKLRQIGWKPRKSVFQGLDELLGEWRETVRNN